MKLVLMDKGYWGYVTGDEPAPVITETDKKEKEVKEYRRTCEKAYSLIALNVQKNIQIHISSITDPKVAWDTLEKQFQFVSITEIVRLSRAFYAATMEEGSDIMKHITKMTALAERLRELKEDISSKKFATTVLGSLPESYELFLSSLNARDADNMDWEQIRPLLIEEFRKRKQKEEKREEEALLVKRNSSMGRYQNQGQSSYQGNNHEFPSNSNNRWQHGGRGTKRGRGGYHQSNNRGNNTKTCYNCNESGHIAQFCPNRVRREDGYFVSAVEENEYSGRDAKRRKLSCEDDDDYYSHLENAHALTSSSSNSSKSDSNDWYIDSAASSHMTHDETNMIEYEKYDEGNKEATNVFLGDNTVIPAEGEGKVQLLTDDGNGGETQLSLEKVLHVPQLAKNLLSVPAMTKTGDSVLFDKEKCHVINENNEKHTIGCVKNGKLYKVNSPKVIKEFANVSSREEKLSRELWHCRLGHLNNKYVDDLKKNNLVNGISIAGESSDSDCEACILGKMQRVSCPKESMNRASNCFEIIHTDVCGPMQVNSVGGSRYLLSFTDDYSRYVTVYFLKRKGEVFEKFKEFCSLVRNRTGRQISKLNIWNNVQTVRSDNGGEYTSNEFKKFCAEKGIAHQFTNPYMPEQNGVAERLNRTLIESVRSMLIHAKLPLKFWAEAVAASVYTHNRSPTSAIKNGTPYELWFGKRPDISNLRVFGCICYFHVPKELRQKLDSKSQKAIFVGYPDGVKGYKVYDIEDNKFRYSNVVKFDETQFYDFTDAKNEWGKDKYTIFPNIAENENEIVPEVDAAVHTIVDPHIEMIVDNVERTDDNGQNRADNPIPVHIDPVGAKPTYEETFMEQVNNLAPVRLRKPPPKLRDNESANLISEKCLISDSLTADADEPSTLKQALNSINSQKWREAMDSEYSSLLKNDTWELVPRPEGINVVGSRWIYKVKRDADGLIERFKARLVAKGYTQTHGVDYSEVFSPVVRTPSLRTVLALANEMDLEVHHMDVTTAFLNGKLDCTVYMEQPEGCVDPDKPEYVCRLNRGLYGLKQAARLWNETIDDYLKSRGYRDAGADGCVYVKSIKDENGNNKFIILLLYVDDIVPVGNDISLIVAEKEALCQEYDMVDNGEISSVLGLKITRDRKERVLTISQPSYLLEMLKRFRMESCNPVSTPLEPGRQFTKIDENDVAFDQQIYQQAIGCLTYASVCTRPDIAAAVGVLSQFMSQPSEDHWSGVKRILRYIKGTLNFGLKFTAGDGILRGYSDADWAGDFDTRRSTSGYAFMIGNATVSWSSKRQATVAKSTAEAEYVALSYATQEAVWLRQLLNDVGFGTNSSTIIFEDNNGAIDLSRNAKYHNRTKHIDISHHFVRERVKSKEIDVVHCPSKDMVADVLTKGIPRVQFHKLRDLLGVCGVA